MLGLLQSSGVELVLTSQDVDLRCVDSNTLTYLVNAIGVDGYDPAQDKSGLADERIAMSRLFLYGDCNPSSAARISPPCRFPLSV